MIVTRMLLLALALTHLAGCRSFTSVTAQAPGTPQVTIEGTALSHRRSFSFAMWEIPSEGQEVNRGKQVEPAYVDPDPHNIDWKARRSAWNARRL